MAEKEDDQRQHIEQQSDEPVTVLGRIGAQPSFFTTRSGVLVGHFALGTRGPEATEWRRVWCSRRRAAQLQQAVSDGELAQGDLAEVRGFVHTRPVRGHDGRTRLREELYAVAVKVRG